MNCRMRSTGAGALFLSLDSKVCSAIRRDQHGCAGMDMAWIIWDLMAFATRFGTVVC